MALSAKNRLSKKRNFDTVFKEGKAIKGSFLFLKIMPNNGPNSRFGFTISSKTAKKAVTRNKIKRELSDLVRLNIGRIKGGYDIIVIIKNGVVGTDRLKDDLGGVLKQSKILA